MKVRQIFVLVWSICIAASVSLAQPSTLPPPLVVAVTNICSSSVRLWRVDSGTNGFISVDFAHYAIATNEDSIREAVSNKRFVQITEGDRVIAQSRVVAQLHGMKADSYLLEFESPESAAAVASRIKELGTVEPPKINTENRTRLIKPVMRQIGDYPPLWGDPSRISRTMSRYRAILPPNTTLEPTATTP